MIGRQRLIFPQKQKGQVVSDPALRIARVGAI
jgi:hypothetical protein